MPERIDGRRVWRAAGLLLLALAAGCGGKVKLVPAEGVLKIDGKPAANVSLQFMPDALKGAKGPTSHAMTDENGRFVLKTFDGRDGAVEGPHRVVLADLAEERPPQGKPSRGVPRLDAAFTLPSQGIQIDVKDKTPLSLEAWGPRR